MITSQDIHCLHESLQSKMRTRAPCGTLQGRPQLRLQKSYQFQVPKTNPKTSPLYLLVSIITIFPFLLCWWKGSRFQSEAWPRPRLGRKTYWHKNKARLTGTRNNIIYCWSPSKAQLEVVGNCATSQTLMHLKFSEVFWGFASDCCFQYVLRFSIDWWGFLRFWFRRLLPFYFRFWGWLGTRAAIILFKR